MKEYVVEIMDENEPDAFVIIKAQNAEEAERIAMVDMGYDVLYVHKEEKTR